MRSSVSAVGGAVRDAVHLTDRSARQRTADRASTLAHAACDRLVKPTVDDAVALGKTLAHAGEHGGAAWADIPANPCNRANERFAYLANPALHLDPVGEIATRAGSPRVARHG